MMQPIVFFPSVVILQIHTFSHFSSLSTASSCTTDTNLPLSGVISHMDQWIFSSWFWMYSIVDGLTPDSNSKHHYDSCLNEADLTHVFSLWGTPSHPVLENTIQPFSITLGGHLNQWNHQQKAQNTKNNWNNGPWKEHLFTGLEARRQCCLVKSQLRTCVAGDKFFDTVCAPELPPRHRSEFGAYR